MRLGVEVIKRSNANILVLPSTRQSVYQVTVRLESGDNLDVSTFEWRSERTQGVGSGEVGCVVGALRVSLGARAARLNSIALLTRCQ